MIGYEQNTSIRTNVKKSKTHQSKPSELYDLSKDISERKNLASTYPNREKQMTQEFKQWVKSTNRTHRDELKK
jgi:hypothetical protein